MSGQINPETELLREQIARERAYQRRRGISAVILWTAGAIFYLWAVIALWIDGLPWLALILLVASAFFGYQIATGMKLYRWGKTPIAKDEIVLRRQEERVYLFQAAHGQIPSEWRLPSLLTKAVFGLLLISYSIWYMINHGPQMGGPIGLAVIGLVICGFTLFEWKQARQLRLESGAILAERLRYGEDTQGEQEINEQEEA